MGGNLFFSAGIRTHDHSANGKGGGTLNPSDHLTMGIQKGIYGLDAGSVARRLLILDTNVLISGTAGTAKTIIYATTNAEIGAAKLLEASGALTVTGTLTADLGTKDAQTHTHGGGAVPD